MSQNRPRLTTQETEFIDVLLDSLMVPKDYQTLVADGAAMERLLRFSEFKRYQKLMAEAMVLLVRRIESADEKDLPGLRGALRQHLMNMKLAEKVVDVAAKMVEEMRQEESDGSKTLQIGR